MHQCGNKFQTAPTAGVVHVWTWDFDCPARKSQQYMQLLSLEEKKRSERLRFSRDRANYVVSHAAVRTILGRYLECHPSRIKFSYSMYGKPSLRLDLGHSPLRFNLSHTEYVGALAVSAGCKLGLDIEVLRMIDGGVAEYFSTLERSELADLGPEEWLLAFYRCWTRKEAILKGEGVGLYRNLDSFDVSLRPGIRAALVGARASAALTADWRLVSFEPAPDHVGAIAIDRWPIDLQCFNFSHETSMEMMADISQDVHCSVAGDA